MRQNRIFAFMAAVLMTCTVAEAGENPRPVFSLALTAGMNSYATISAFPGTQTIYESEAPVVNWMDKSLGFGIEAGARIGPFWRIVLGGTFNYGLNPGYSAVPGTSELNATGDGGIPTYRAVAAQKTLSYCAYTGFDYLFMIGTLPKLKPILGLRLGGAYGSNSKKWDDPATMGASVAEAFYLKTAIVGGVDYFFTENFFLGLTLNFFDYTYVVSRQKPQEGLAALSADAHNFGAFANPALRIGFCF